ncbi:unnamed protein product [Coffea canephora]|uniref:DH200=94 genomic scaffold, scaffold_2147 n=1 Tax=Coffea canephora TaxID=49390 RepID=A0A068VK24_COFCA|nr:unnamed protein product [Coffea canephora]
MAELSVAKIIDVLGDVAVKQLGKKINLVMGVEEEVENIKDMLETIQKMLHDAERRRLEEPVGKWLEKLEDITYEMDDVLDEWNFKIHRAKNEGTNQNARMQPTLRNKKIKKINERLELTLEKARQFNFITSGGISDSQDFQRIITTSIIDESEVCGRKADMEKLLDQVLSESSGQGRKRVQIISVVGAGGSGKTTLAQLLFNDDRVKKHFELKKWVCVSHPFDEKRIARAILASLEESSLDSLELEQLLQQLKTTFSGKRFLLVLDDVWTEDDSKWKPFKDSLKDGAPGSVILVTTRSHRVATVVGTTHTHQMTQMSDSDCWLIMQRLAFANKSGDLCKKVKRIGQKISEKCKGLPLAAKTMGSLLRFKDTVQQWQNVLDSEIWQLEEAAVELFPHLYLSYNELSPELKRCFSYCAVFPKDHVIVVEELISLWIAQGYVRPRRRGEHLDLVGLEYFNNLTMRSFFQEVQKFGTFDEYEQCKMHDIVHDFAQFLTKSECHALDGTGRNSSTEIPAEIGRLIHLRHLDLSQNRFVALPETICDLYYLETLNIYYCDKLSCLPERIEGLVHLRHLFNIETPKLQTPSCIESMEPPPNLDRLALTSYPGTQLPSWLVKKSLINNLRKLIICEPRNISSLLALWKLSSLEELALVGVENLECLGKEFFRSSFSTEVVAFPNLRKLHFGSFQNWKNWEDLSEDDEEVAVSIMPRLEEIKIYHCEKLEILPHRIFKKISSLKNLEIRYCFKLWNRYSDKTGDNWIKISHIPRVHISNHYYFQPDYPH